MKKKNKLLHIKSMPKNFRLYVKKIIPTRAVQIDTSFYVKTATGYAQGEAGDYLIEGFKGNLYICKQDWFEHSYMPYE